ncbi:MAG TPA: carboxypeptidase regulatory-like domain-containing protein, partial [Stenomitos sp.]
SPVSLDPAQRPPDFIAHQVVDPSTGQVFESGEAIAGGRLTVKLFKAGTTERIGDAKVTLIGPTLASGTSTSALDLTLQPLKPGSYQVRVEAPGYATILTNPVTLDATNPTTVQYELSPSAGDVTGRALDGSGNPLVGAWVNVDDAYAFTDSNGAFRLKGAPIGSQTVAVAKTGFAPAAVTTTLSSGETSLGDVRLTARERSVYLQNAAQPFGGSAVGTALGALTTALQGDGFTLQTTANDPAIRIIASPTASSIGDVAATAESLRSFVAAGGKLVLLGEWGGFADYDPDTLNRLAQPYGIAFNPDLIRLSGTHPSWIQIPAVGSALPAPTPVSSGIELFESSSLLAPAPAVPVASTGSGGFRVSALLNGDFVVAAARPYGRGLVVAVGDTSAWVTPATQGGASNLDVSSNRAFILDLLRW